MYRAAADGVPTLTDKGYEGAGIGVHSPVRGRDLDVANQTYNALLTSLRALGEQRECRAERPLAVPAANPAVPQQDRRNHQSSDRAIDAPTRKLLRKPHSMGRGRKRYIPNGTFHA